eukprot:s2091_g8.t1
MASSRRCWTSPWCGYKSGERQTVSSSNTFTSRTVILDNVAAQALSLFAQKFPELQRKESMLISTCLDLHARTYPPFLDL